MDVAASCDYGNPSMNGKGAVSEAFAQLVESVAQQVAISNAVKSVFRSDS